MRSHITQRGFTLVELLVTIVVAAVLLSVAVPNFRDLLARNELTTVANEWVGALRTARAEAVKRNRSVALCGEGDVPTDGAGSECTASLAGQVRYLPRNSGSTEALHAAVVDTFDQPLELVSSTTVRFRGDGIGYRGDSMTEPYTTVGGGSPVVELCTPVLTNNNVRRVELIAGSTVKVVTKTRANCP